MAQNGPFVARPWVLYWLWLFSAPGLKCHPLDVCFNNCSGHGACRDFICQCDAGYHGDDCRHSFMDGQQVIPMFTAGHSNLSLPVWQDSIKQSSLTVAIVSSAACHICIKFEPGYQNATAQLAPRGVVVGRVNIDLQHELALELLPTPETALPALVLLDPKRKRQRRLYDGPHTGAAITEYVVKQLGEPLQVLGSREAVVAFLAGPFHGQAALPFVTVIGLFGDMDMEEEEYAEFLEAAAKLQGNRDTYFGAVVDPELAAHYKTQGWAHRTPAVVLQRAGDTDRHVAYIGQLEDEWASLEDWVEAASVPLVGQLTEQNFANYQRLGLPMLILFLNLADSGGAAGGMLGASGGLRNADLLAELEATAGEHRGRISFVYADGVAFADSMKSLGLYGAAERLPQVALNTKDRRQLPFPEDLPINRDTLLSFCADFLSGRMRSAADAKEQAKRALQNTKAVNPKNTAKRRKRKQPPPEQKGVSEEFSGAAGLVQVTAATFEDIALDADKDVVIIFHSRECESCSYMAPYYKRVAERFLDLKVGSVVVAAMDVSDEVPPPRVGLTLPTLPAILMLPARDKGPSFRFFSGYGKVGPLMRWVQEFASYPFELPELPHLREQDKELYKQQVREREEHLASHRVGTGIDSPPDGGVVGAVANTARTDL